MLDDLAEGSVRVILRFFVRLFFEVIFFYTGEIVLALVTFGTRKPRWNYYTDESATKFVIFTELSVWVGFATWLFLFWFVGTKLLASG